MKLLYLPNQYNQQRQREKKRWIWPVHLAMEATYHKMMGDSVLWDYPQDEHLVDKVITELEGINFNSLPAPDRKLTRAMDPKYQNNGNFKHHPGTYTQSAAGCWWGKCKFCKEKGVHYKLKTVHDVIADIAHCQRMGFKEVFDDAASFPAGSWREKFIHMKKRIDITFSCNMRFGTKPDFKAMKEAGFRMLLYGLESANQETLNGISKGTDIGSAIQELILASLHGLEPHIAYMVSYPWETLEEEMNTIRLVQHLLKKGYVKTAQCSVYCPPDGEICQDKAHLTSKLYNVAFMPEFWYNRFKDLRSIDDLKYLLRGVKEGLGGLWGRK